MCCIIIPALVGGIAAVYYGSRAIDWLANIYVSPKDRR